MKSTRSTGHRLARLVLLIVAGLGGAATAAWAQAEPGRPAEIGPAERNAAIRRVLADRAGRASPIGRATAAMHRSLVEIEALAGAATRDMESGITGGDSETVRALILEGHNLRVAYETVQSSLTERRAGARPRPAVRSQSARGRLSPAPPAPAFGHVERVLELQERLAELTEADVSARAASILGALQLAAARSLQSIRRDSVRVSGVVHGAGAEFRRAAIPPE